MGPLLLLSMAGSKVLCGKVIELFFPLLFFIGFQGGKERGCLARFCGSLLCIIFSLSSLLILASESDYNGVEDVFFSLSFTLAFKSGCFAWLCRSSPWIICYCP